VVPELVATFASGILAGAAIYINLVEQPARLSCGNELAVTQWRPSCKRGTVMQAPLALIGALAALLSYSANRRFTWLVGGLFLLLIIPFTLVVILPINEKLQSQELDLRSDDAGDLLRRWGRLHAVRSILSLAAFLLFLISLLWRQ
jgi:uncharacterized membrane protein